MGKNAQKKALKKAAEAPMDETQKMIAKVKPVASEVLSIIGAHKGPLGGGETPAAEYEASYALPAAEILNVYLKHNLKLNETEFVKKLVLQGVEWPLNIVTATVQKHAQTAEKLAYGSEMGEMTFGQLDKILKGEEGGLLTAKKPE